MKRCGHCDEHKPTSEFYVDRRNRDGLWGTCKACVRARAKAIDTPEKRAQGVERSRAYRLTPAGKAARRREYDNNRATILARVGKWQQENRERSAATKRRWAEKNPEQRRMVARLHSQRRRVALAATADLVTDEAVQARIAYFGERCWCCGEPWEQLDHVKPIAKGGPHLPANLRPICAPCNRSKSAKWPIDTRSAA
jgi:5-methylcytosine-specific restriction endonuclease McrA